MFQDWTARVLLLCGKPLRPDRACRRSRIAGPRRGDVRWILRIFVIFGFKPSQNFVFVGAAEDGNLIAQLFHVVAA